MAEVQLGLFDLGYVDAEAIQKQQKVKQDAEMDAMLLKILGPRGAKKWKRQNAELTAKLEAISSKPLRPDLQEGLDALRAKAKASTKPFLSAEYALLGIERGATKRDIKNAYRRQARKLHPDRGGDAAAFARMDAAYHKLLANVKD